MVEPIERDRSESRLNQPQLPGWAYGLLRNQPRGAIPKTPGFSTTNFDEPVDPTDCGRWFDSPFCKGNPPVNPVKVDLFAPFAQQKLNPRITLFPTGLGIRDIGVNNCQAWICIGGSILGVSGPPFCFSYTAPNCRLPEPPQPPQARAGLGAAVQPPFQASPFTDGWVRDCQYIVTITTGYHTAIGGNPIGGPWARKFDRFGQAGDEDFVFSAWGPIVGLEHRYAGMSYEPDEAHPVYFFDVYLHCRGLGVWSIPALRQQNAAYRPLRLADAAQFVLGITNPRQGSTFLEGRSLHLRPYQEMWISPPGVVVDPIFGGVTFHDDVQPCYLFTMRRVPGVSESYYSFYDVRKAHRIEPYVYPDGEIASLGNVCAPVPPPPPPPPPARRQPNMSCNCCSCDEISRLIDAKLVRIYKILGFGASGPIKAVLTPEQTIEAYLSDAYSKDPPKAVEVGDIPKLMAAIQIAAYYRAGSHRFPARLPESLTEDNKNGQVTIQDAASMHEWLIKQIDALHGAYPVKLKFRDGNNKEHDLKFDNQSELLSELMGLLLSINTDTDIITDLSMRTLVEALGARMAGTTAADYAKGNAEFLGYRFKQSERKVNLSFSPLANNLKKFLQPSEMKTDKFENDDKDSLLEMVKSLIISAGIIKGAFFRSFKLFGRDLPGERIKDDLKKQTADDDADWLKFVNDLQNPPPRQKDPDAPIPKIDRLSGDEGSQQ